MVLTSGDNASIAKWRRAEAIRRTAERRPDERGRRADPDAVGGPRGLIEAGARLLRGAVEIVVLLRGAQRRGGLNEGVSDWRRVLIVDDGDLPDVTVVRRTASTVGLRFLDIP